MKQIAIRYGGWMFVGFTALFLIMHVLGLGAISWLRVLNAPIHLAGMWIAIRAWLRMHPGESDNYPAGVALGMMVTTAAVVPFTIFLAIFLAYNPSLMSQIQHQSALAEHLTPVTASLFATMEAYAVGLIGSWVIIRTIETMYYRSV